ncbi:hypothetical protein B0H10DRAFT_2098648 [Mycena sp. CBHHK59/15]|nr:hypothetical protein B0H10DRAFT_2098648 [Mycena sp. CBHHK59/15]
MISHSWARGHILSIMPLFTQAMQLVAALAAGVWSPPVAYRIVRGGSPADRPEAEPGAGHRCAVWLCQPGR